MVWFVSERGISRKYTTNAEGTRTELAEQLDEARMTVRLLILLLERAFIELLQTEGADEVLRVELFVHGGDAAARDRLLAAGAQRAAFSVVVRLAVREAVVVVEACRTERHVTLLRG